MALTDVSVVCDLRGQWYAAPESLRCCDSAEAERGTQRGADSSVRQNMCQATASSVCKSSEGRERIACMRMVVDVDERKLHATFERRNPFS